MLTDVQLHDAHEDLAYWRRAAELLLDKDNALLEAGVLLRAAVRLGMKLLDEVESLQRLHKDAGR